jgi:hypothetical protein
MLTGAHASLIPLITGLHNEAKHKNECDVQEIIRKINAILSFDAEGWAQNMAVDMIIDFFHKLPEEILTEVTQNIELHDGIPLRLCLFLMDKNANVAQQLIENTDILDTTDLLYRIHSGQVHEMIAVARRRNLSLDVLNALIESKQPEVYMTLLENQSIEVQQDVLQHLTELAHRSAKLAWYMVSHVKPCVPRNVA